MIDELLDLSPTISDPHQVAVGNPDRPGDADLRPLEPFPQAPQSRDPPAAYPGPVNPEDNRRVGVYPHIEVEPTADVCPSRPARDAVDQAETAGSSGLALGPNQRGKGGGEVEASIPVMAMVASAPDEGSAGEPILLDAGRSCHACADRRHVANLPQNVIPKPLHPRRPRSWR